MNIHHEGDAVAGGCWGGTKDVHHSKCSCNCLHVSWKEIVEMDLPEDLCYRWGNRQGLLGTVENGLLRPSLEPEVQKVLDPQKEQETDPREDRHREAPHSGSVGSSKTAISKFHWLHNFPPLVLVSIWIWETFVWKLKRNSRLLKFCSCFGQLPDCPP